MFFDLFAAADPGAAQAELYRSGVRVYHDKATNIRLVLGDLAEVRAVMLNSRSYSNVNVLTPICPAPAAVYRVLSGLPQVRSLVALDPPKHGVRRKALEDLIPQRPASVRKKWGTVVSDRVNAVVTAVKTPRVDLKKIAEQIALEVLCDIVGLPLADQHKLEVGTKKFGELAWSDPAATVQLVDAERSLALWGYCVDAVRQRLEAGSPDGGLLGELLQYRGDDGWPLPREVVEVELLNVIGAGWITTADAVCHVIARTMAEPGGLARLALDDEYLDRAVWETLRIDPPISAWKRETTRDVDIDGVTIDEGSPLLVGIAGANRDPGVFGAHPDRFDPERLSSRKHLAFGVGDHRCIGKHLALLVITTAVRAIAMHLPDLCLDPDGEQGTVRSAVLYQRRELLAVTGKRPGCPVGHGAAPAVGLGSADENG